MMWASERLCFFTYTHDQLNDLNMQTQQYLSFADECKYKWVQKKYRMYVLGFRIKKIKGGHFYPGTGTIAYSILRREV